MKEQLKQVMYLKEEGRFDESNKLLLELYKRFPNDTLVNYYCAWSFDALGEETKAIPYYKKAIQLGLAGENLEGALLGLGSTYRALGQYEKSQEIFKKGIELFPKNNALKVFYSMTLFNLTEYQKAMEVLLHCMIETVQDPNILKYKRAIEFYSNKLDETWE